jgi:hypothetical protein
MKRRVLVSAVVTAVSLGVWAAAVGDAAGVGKPNPGAGIGTNAALAGPNCDPDTGRVKLPYTGTPQCVRELADGEKNGGATAPGVTADTIKVAVLVWNEQQAEAAVGVAPRNQATGSRGTQEDAVDDTAEVFEHATYLWGRDIEYTFVTSTGSDEAAQRADAVTVSTMRPFVVINLAGGSTFDSQVAARKIVVLTSGNATKEQTTSLAPYLWAQQPDPDGAATNAAEVIGKSLNGRRAKWAGDPDLRRQERKFGVVYPPTIIDYPGFETALGKYGATEPAVKIEYEPPSEGSSNANLTALREIAPTIITRLKNAGVNNVILLAQNLMTQALLEAATSQEFSPEWTITGYGVNDFDYFARQFDQEQYAHAFGIGSLPPAVLNTPDYTSVLFQWYWGQTQGTVQAQTTGLLATLYSGIQMAGPRLTARTFQRGLFTSPPVGGAAQDQVTTIQRAYGKSAGLPYDEYHQSGTDFSYVWWDPDAEGPSNIFPLEGTGKLQFLDDAKRYTAGKWPKGEPKYFDESASLLLFDGIPASDQVPDYPCDGCPSSAAGP